MKIRRSLGFWIHYKSLSIEKQYCTNNKKEEKKHCGNIGKQGAFRFVLYQIWYCCTISSWGANILSSIEIQKGRNSNFLFLINQKRPIQIKTVKITEETIYP